MLVVPDSKYTSRVLVQVGIGVIEKLIQITTDEELNQASDVWKKTHLSMVLAKQLVRAEEQQDITSFHSSILTTKNVIIPPFTHVEISGLTKVWGHSKGIHVIVEPPERAFSGKAVAAPTYTEIKPRLSWVGMSLCNLSSKETTIPARVVLGQVQAANIIHNTLAPHCW